MTSKTDYLEKKQVCKNCNSVHINNYCSDCGQKIYTKRFTLKSFFIVFMDALNIKKGFFYTVKMLFTHPGKVTNDYISGKTKSYFNPLKYIIIVAGIYAFLIVWLNIFDASIEASEIIQKNNEALQNNDEALQLQKKWIEFYKQYINFIPLLMVPFASLISKWFYRSKKLFYGEHLIINCFIFAQIFIIYIIWSPIVVIIPSLITYFPVITFITSFIYFIFALYKTFRESPFRAVMGGILIYFIGFLFFILFLSIIIFIVGLIVVIKDYNIADLL